MTTGVAAARHRPYEAALREIAAELIACAAADLGSGIDGALAKAVEVAHLDSVHVSTVDRDFQWNLGLYSWPKDRVLDEALPTERFVTEFAARIEPLLRRGEALRLDLERLRRSYPELANHYLDRGVVSLLVTSGVWVSGSLGVLAIASREPVEDWGEFESLGSGLANAVGAAIARQRDHTALVQSEHRMRALLARSSDITMICDDHGIVRFVTPSVERVMGWAPDALMGRSVDELVGAREAERAQRLTHGEPFVLRVAHRDGSWRYLEAVVTDLRHDPAIGGTLINARDVTDWVEAERALAEQARRDPLTGLANRSSLMDRLEAALAASRRDRSAVAVLFIDLDGFKRVNDSFGHARGDEVLLEVAQRIVSVMRAGETVARLGGVEFVVVLSSRVGNFDPEAAAQRILDALADHPLGLGASIGVAVHEPGAPPIDGAALLSRADAAMYRLKQPRLFRHGDVVAAS